KPIGRSRCLGNRARGAARYGDLEEPFVRRVVHADPSAVRRNEEASDPDTLGARNGNHVETAEAACEQLGFRRLRIREEIDDEGLSVTGECDGLNGSGVETVSIG